LGFLYRDGSVDVGGSGPQAAIVVAALWSNTLLTIACGFLALFLLQRLIA